MTTAQLTEQEATVTKNLEVLENQHTQITNRLTELRTQIVATRGALEMCKHLVAMAKKDEESKVETKE